MTSSSRANSGSDWAVVGIVATVLVAVFASQQSKRENESSEQNADIRTKSIVSAVDGAAEKIAAVHDGRVGPPDVQVHSVVMQLEMARNEEGIRVVAHKPRDSLSDCFVVVNRGQTIARDLRFVWTVHSVTVAERALVTTTIIRPTPQAFRSLRKSELAMGETLELTWIPSEISQLGLRKLRALSATFDIHFTSNDGKPYMNRYDAVFTSESQLSPERIIVRMDRASQSPPTQ